MRVCLGGGHKSVPVGEVDVDPGLRATV